MMIEWSGAALSFSMSGSHHADNPASAKRARAQEEDDDDDDKLKLRERCIAHLTRPPPSSVRESPLRQCLALPLIPNGLILEFGVFSGRTINQIASAKSRDTIHGFDTFTGLPEDWRPGFPQGKFSTQGKLPDVRKNVVLHTGLFEETLVPFLESHDKTPVALAHLDADLYSATIFVLRTLGPRIQPGTILVFDELINYKGWEQGEFKAFVEAAVELKWEFEWLFQSCVMELVPVLDIANSQQVAVRITGVSDD
jgi:hypothetical protein